MANLLDDWLEPSSDDDEKPEAYDTTEWQRHGFCSICIRPLEVRNRGKEARHVEDQTPYCGKVAK